MKYYYLLFSLFLLMHFQAKSQSEVYYASRTNAGLYFEESKNTLKKSLHDLERSFGVSIAYKDEWVENRNVAEEISGFKSVEDALSGLLKGTDLYYEKAGERFYVIYEKDDSRIKTGGKRSLSVLLPSLYASSDVSRPSIKPIITALQEDQQALAPVVSGVVTDENNSSFPGVNVLVKGTMIGTSTNSDGRYSLDVENENAILVFSFVGYATQEIAVGGRTSIDLVMQPDAQSLDEVVVTALGIERSSKSLGYATSKVDSKELVVNRTPNMMNALQGKIAGVNISSLGTGPGGTSKVRIRGQSSIGGQNSPLIVVNGVPIDNTNFGTNIGMVQGGDGSVQSRGGGAATDGGDGLTSFNPDDIESMQVLKGATAAALYGSRAKDGVIMITTKSRGASQGIGVSYNLNYTTEKVLDFTDYQYEYGQGEYGGGPAAPNAAANPNSGQWSFGRKIEPGMTQLLFDGDVVPYEAQRGILDQFYRAGQNLTNSISISSGGEKGGMNFSFSNLDSKGITPNNKYVRNTINFGFGYDLSPKLSVRGNINYSNEDNTNPPVVSDQDNSIPTSLLAMANTMPLSVLDENKYNAGGGEFNYSRFTNRTNPYWTLAEVKQNIRRDRLFGNFSLKYDVTDWLSVQARAGQDYWSRDNDYINLPTGKASINASSIFSAAAPGFYNGLYTQETRRFRETNYDFLITAAKTFNDFGVNINAGGNQMTRRMDVNSVQVTDFVVRDLYTVQNGRAKDPTYDLIERGVNSLYAMAEVNYKEILYLNGTFRQDWFSTLSIDENTIPYYSISASYVFSESFNSKPGWLNFGKFRAAYAGVGSDSDVAPYSNALYYGVNGQQFQGQAIGNFGLTVPNANLRPMSVEETELGLELKMFNNRVNLDLAVYRKLTTDQIVNATISDASGFTGTQINSGESENKGIEIMLNLVPVSTNNFQWDFTFTGAYNKTKVLSLLTDEPGTSITVGSHVFNGWVYQTVGEELGQIVGFGYRRNDQGQIIYNTTSGLPLATPAPISFGSALPKWTGGFMNSFTYKGLVATFLIDFKLGGKLLSGTNFNAYRHGLHKDSLLGREGGTLDANGNDPGFVVGEGVNQEGSPNTTGAKNEDYFSVVRGAGLVEPVIYDAGYWKLRQITIGYDFTKFLPESFPVKGMRLSFVANNVLMLKKWAPNIDPESFSYTSDNVVGLESPSVPTTRSIGFNLNVKF